MIFDGKLITEFGDIFNGKRFGYKYNVCGELIFNTAITGYQEVITDPSYNNQIVIFTNPHIGNVGISDEDFESETISIKGIITRELPTNPSSWRSHGSLNSFLVTNKIAGLAYLDTRMLTKKIRDCGSLKSIIVDKNFNHDDAVKICKHWKPSKNNYNRLNTSIHYVDNKKNIIVYDLGCKKSIINNLKALNFNVIQVGGNNVYNLLKDNLPDGIILSNGPGNPEDYIDEINNIKKLIKLNIPILGICLGHQLLALCYNYHIEKMKFGHHGINHPVMEVSSKKVFITSQNHNYVIGQHKDYRKITHISLLDGSVQGMEFKKNLHYGFQGHPEGGPGPNEINKLFKDFLAIIMENPKK